MKTINTIKSSALVRSNMARLMGAYARMGGVLTKEACKELWASAKKLANKMENEMVYISDEQHLEIRMGIARDMGKVEPVLYAGDTLAYVPETEEQKETRITLGQIIDLQERMSKGMKLINQNKAALVRINKDIQALWVDAPWMTKIFCSWKKIVLGETKYDGWITNDVANRFLSDKRNARAIGLFNARHAMYANQKKLWAHWMKLQNTCKELIGNNTKVWPAYFQLAQEEINTYMISGGDYVEKIDNSTLAECWDSMASINDMAITHIQENKECAAYNVSDMELAVNKNIPSREAVNTFIRNNEPKSDDVAYWESLIKSLEASF